MSTVISLDNFAEAATMREPRFDQSLKAAEGADMILAGSAESLPTKRVARAERMELLARFGSGALVKTTGGKYEFRGGNRGDRIEAIDWVSIFAPEIVLALK